MSTFRNPYTLAVDTEAALVRRNRPSQLTGAGDLRSRIDGLLAQYEDESAAIGAAAQKAVAGPPRAPRIAYNPTTRKFRVGNQVFDESAAAIKALAEAPSLPDTPLVAGEVGVDQDQIRQRDALLAENMTWDLASRPAAMAENVMGAFTSGIGSLTGQNFENPWEGLAERQRQGQSLYKQRGYMEGGFDSLTGAANALAQSTETIVPMLAASAIPGVGAVAGIGLGGLMSADSQAEDAERNVREALKNATADQLVQNPEYMKYYAQGYNHDQIVEKLTRDAKMAAGWTGGAIGLAGAGVGQAIGRRILGERIGSVFGQPGDDAIDAMVRGIRGANPTLGRNIAAGGAASVGGGLFEGGQELAETEGAQSAGFAAAGLPDRTFATTDEFAGGFIPGAVLGPLALFRGNRGAASKNDPSTSDPSLAAALNQASGTTPTAEPQPDQSGAQGGNRQMVPFQGGRPQPSGGALRPLGTQWTRGRGEYRDPTWNESDIEDGEFNEVTPDAPLPQLGYQPDRTTPELNDALSLPEDEQSVGLAGLAPEMDVAPGPATENPDVGETGGFRSRGSIGRAWQAQAQDARRAESEQNPSLLPMPEDVRRDERAQQIEAQLAEAQTYVAEIEAARNNGVPVDMAMLQNLQSYISDMQGVLAQLKPSAAPVESTPAQLLLGNDSRATEQAQNTNESERQRLQDELDRVNGRIAEAQSAGYPVPKGFLAAANALQRKLQSLELVQQGQSYDMFGGQGGTGGFETNTTVRTRDRGSFTVPNPNAPAPGAPPVRRDAAAAPVRDQTTTTSPQLWIRPKQTQTRTVADIQKDINLIESLLAPDPEAGGRPAGSLSPQVNTQLEKALQSLRAELGDSAPSAQPTGRARGSQMPMFTPSGKPSAPADYGNKSALEGRRDIEAQVAEMLDPNDSRDSVWVARGSEVPTNVPSEGVIRVEVPGPGGGVFLTTDSAKARRVRANPKRAATDPDFLSEIMGYTQTKTEVRGAAARGEPVAAVVTEVPTPRGPAVTKSEVTTAAAAPAAAEKQKKGTANPKAKTTVKPVEQALDERAKRAEEDLQQEFLELTDEWRDTPPKSPRRRQIEARMKEIRAQITAMTQDTGRGPGKEGLPRGGTNAPTKQEPQREAEQEPTTREDLNDPTDWMTDLYDASEDADVVRGMVGRGEDFDVVPATAYDGVDVQGIDSPQLTLRQEEIIGEDGQSYRETPSAILKWYQQRLENLNRVLTCVLK